MSPEAINPTVATEAEKPIFAFKPQELARFFEQEGTVIRAEEVDLEKNGVRIITTGIRIVMDVDGVKKTCITNRNVFPNLVLSDMKQPDDQPITRNPHYPTFEEDRATLLDLERKAHTSLLKLTESLEKEGKENLKIQQIDRSTIIISQAAYARLGQTVLIFYQQWTDHEYSERLLPEPPADSVA